MYNATEYQQQNNSILDVTKDVITAFEFSKKIETFLKEDQENNPKLTEEILSTKSTEFISKLTIDKLFEGIVSLQKIIDGKTAYGHHYVKEKDVTIFIGATRAGKSTIMNLLLDNKLVSSKLSGNLFNSFYVLNEKNPSNGQYPKIGHKHISETTIPIVYKVDNKIIIDCPGFGDNRSAQQQIINAWFISELLKNSKGIKVVNVCASTSLADTQNRIEFSSYAKQLQSFFTKDDLCEVKNILFFTKYPNEEKFDGKTEILKETAIELIAKDQNNFSRELLKFFNNSKAFSMKSPTKSDVEFTKETIRDMIDYHDKNLNYTKIQPNISLDGDAKSWVLTNKNDMITAIMNSLRKSYWKVYEDGTVKSNFDTKIKEHMNSKQLSILSKKFVELKNSDISNLIREEKNLIDSIKNFIKEILKPTDIGSMIEKFEEELKSAKEIVELHNNRVIEYNLSIPFLKFLLDQEFAKDHQTSDYIKKMIEAMEKKKPNSDDLKKSGVDLQKLVTDSSKFLDNLGTEIKHAVNNDIQEKKNQQLQKMIQEQQQQIKKMVEANKPSLGNLIMDMVPIPICKWTFAIASTIKAIGATINHLERKNSSDNDSIGQLLTIGSDIDLPRSFNDYIEKDSPLALYGEIFADEYWGKYDSVIFKF